jgi:hypothetical protein
MPSNLITLRPHGDETDRKRRFVNNGFPKNPRFSILTARPVASPDGGRRSSFPPSQYEG